MPITLRKTTKIVITNCEFINGKDKEQPKKNYAQSIKIETKSNTVKVLR